MDKAVGCHMQFLYNGQLLQDSVFWLVTWHSRENRSFASKLSLCCTRPTADRWPLMWIKHLLWVSQLGQLSLSSFQGW